MTKTEQDEKITEWLSWGMHNGVCPELLVVAALALGAAQERYSQYPYSNPTKKEEPVILTGNRPEDGESEWQRITQNQIESAEHWLEFQRAVADARPYSNPTKKEEPVILTGNRPEDNASQTAKGLVQPGFLYGGYGTGKSSVVMLDEWPECDPDVLKDIRDKLNPLLVKRFEGMNTREVYDALQQDVFEQAIMKLSDEEIAVLKTVWKVEG